MFEIYLKKTKMSSYIIEKGITCLKKRFSYSIGGNLYFPTLKTSLSVKLPTDPVVVRGAEMCTY